MDHRIRSAMRWLQYRMRLRLLCLNLILCSLGSQIARVNSGTDAVSRDIIADQIAAKDHVACAKQILNHRTVLAQQMTSAVNLHTDQGSHGHRTQDKRMVFPSFSANLPPEALFGPLRTGEVWEK